MQFIMKVLNEDRNNLAFKIAETEDNIKMYFYNDISLKHYEIEVNPSTQSLLNPNDIELVDLYLQNKIQLVHTDLKMDQMFEEISHNINILEKEFIKPNDQLFSDTLKTVEDLNIKDFPSIHQIQVIFDEFEKNKEAINKIEVLEDKIQTYLKSYQSNENMTSVNHGQVQLAKIENLSETWSEMKELYTRQKDFLKIALDYETEKYLKDVNHVMAKINLSGEYANTSELLSKGNIETLTTGQVLAATIQDSEYTPLEKVENMLKDLKGLDYIDHYLSRLELFNPDVQYSGSNIDKYIDRLVNSQSDKLLSFVEHQMKERYGSSFNLLEEEQNFKTSELTKVVSPIVEHSAFNIMDFQEKEPVTKTDYLVRDFWESKSLDMLMEYNKNQAIEKSFEKGELYFRSKDIEKMIRDVPEMLQNPLGEKQIEKANIIIEDTQKALYDLKKGVLEDLKYNNQLLKADGHSDDMKKRHNITKEHVRLILNIDNKLENLKDEIKEVKQEIRQEKQNEKKYEQER